MALQKPSYIKFAPSWLLYGFVWLIAQLPYFLAIKLGAGLGAVFKMALKSRKKVVQKNIEICFPKHSKEDTKQLTNANFKESGIMLTQTLKAFLSQSNLKNNEYEIIGANHLETFIAKKQGVLLVAGHFTALDMGGKILCSQFPVAGMYRPHKHPLTEYIVTKSRLKYADKMFKRDELRGIVKHLKSGGVLWYAPDQDYRRGQSVFAKFFGHTASTITATHQLARLSGCKVMFFSVLRNKQKPYYTLELSPALEDFPTKDALQDTQRINDGIENMVKKSPEQYLWVHKRFKTQPEGQESPY